MTPLYRDTFIVQTAPVPIIMAIENKLYFSDKWPWICDDERIVVVPVGTDTYHTDEKIIKGLRDSTLIVKHNTSIKLIIQYI